MSGNPLGPGTSEYGRICVFFGESFSAVIGLVDNDSSFGKMLIADENAVRFTSELVAVRVLILFFTLQQAESISLFVRLFMKIK